MTEEEKRNRIEELDLEEDRLYSLLMNESDRAKQKEIDLQIREVRGEINRLQDEIKKEKENSPAAIAERKRKKVEKEHQNLINSGVGYRYQDVDIHSYKCDIPEQKTALELVKEFICHPYGKNLWLIGNPGNGKTLLASIICRYLGARYIKSSQLKDELDFARSFNAKKNPSEVIREYAKKDFLIIDEVGAYKSSSEQEYIFRLMNERYEEKNPTVLISNMNKKEFGEYLGTLVVDRFTEGCKVIEFNWESHRKKERIEWDGEYKDRARELFEE